MLPCESATKYKVPAIKAKLAHKLKEQDYSQKQIASILGVTEAAVSQYLSGKRAIAKTKEKPKKVQQVCELCKLCI